MRDPKFFVFCFVLLSVTLTIRAQDSVANCDEIKVETKTTSPSNNGDDGTIDLIFSKSSDNYRIFLLNAGENNDAKEELKNSRITNLRAGFFDFLIIDKNRKGCIRQLTVVLK